MNVLVRRGQSGRRGQVHGVHRGVNEVDKTTTRSDVSAKSNTSRESRPEAEAQPGRFRRGSRGLRRSLARARQGFETIAWWKLALACCVFGALMALLYRPFKHHVISDPAIYDYIAQSIVRGQMPYRDVVDIKGPGAAYLSALAILVGKLAGLRDVLAIRTLEVLLIGLFSSSIYLVGQAYLRSRLASLIAVLLPLMAGRFLLMAVYGTQPKLPMMIFGLLSLWFVARERPFWAGFCSMLSCLCWQPGLMFTGVAFLMFSRYLTAWRDLRALKVVAGAALPLAVVITYFHLRGALEDMWSWTIVYNYTVFRPIAQKEPLDGLVHIGRVILRVFKVDWWMFAAGLVGMVMYAIRRVREKVRQRKLIDSPDYLMDAILLPPTAYFAFSLINFQAGADLIPFIPFAALFVGWFIAALPRLSRSGSLQWLPPAVAVLVCLIAIGRGSAYRVAEITLKEQDVLFAQIREWLKPGDRIYVHGTTEILVVLNIPNLNPYLLLDGGADEFIASRKPGGFAEVIAEIESQRPKLVSITRLKAVRHRADFERWVETNYDLVESFKYDRLYIRKGTQQATGISP